MIPKYRVTRKGKHCAKHADRRVWARGLCRACYNGLQAKGSMPKLEAAPCKCGKPAHRNGVCRACKNAKHKEWRLANPKVWAAQQRKARLKKVYGLAPSDFDAMLLALSNQCPICATPFELKPGPTQCCIDHDHTTGKVRSLLCNLCNVALGSMRDSPALLRKAALYLEAHSK